MAYKDKVKEKAYKKVYFPKWWNSEAGRRYREKVALKKIEQHKKYRQSEKGKIVARRKAKNMRAKYPEKWSARSKLRYAVKQGKIKKLPCEKCGDLKSFAHHKDYTKPLEVIWLCMTHHREVHENKC